MAESTIIIRQRLMAVLGVSSETIRRWLKSGRLPKPDVSVSRRTVAWKPETLKAAGIDLD